jgi:hypothetical protein
VKRKVKFARAAVAVLPVALGMGAAQAFEIDSGNPDVVIRLDNSVRYNLGVRTQSQNSMIINNNNVDDSDRNFKRGSLVANRLDLLSEFDVVYQKSFGGRVSGAAWYDAAYSNLDNTNVATSNHLQNGQAALGLSDTTKRYYLGPSGELLDAFVFGKFDLGGSPLNVKLGRHTLFWGEAMLSAIHSLSYGQSGLDIRKAAAVPGTEIKELFMPRNALSAQLQVNPEVSLAAQYFLAWNPIRLPQAGSYLAAADFMHGSESRYLGPFQAARGADVTPNERGDWGVAARVQPNWLQGTAGFYYRKTADIQPELNVVFPTSYNHVYQSGIKIYGASLSKGVGDLSLGAEINYRTNMPLVSEGIGVKGNTWHLVANLMGSIAGTALFDSAGWLAEVQWNRLGKVTNDPNNLYKGRDSYVGSDKVTKDFVGLAVSFSPTWYQVMPGVDLSLPLFVSGGLVGNSVVSGGGYKNAANYSVGLGAEVDQKYSVKLSYTGSTSPYTLGADGVIDAGHSPIPATVIDRGFVSLTLKTQF